MPRLTLTELEQRHTREINSQRDRIAALEAQLAALQTQLNAIAGMCPRETQPCPECKGHPLRVDDEGNPRGCSHCNGTGTIGESHAAAVERAIGEHEYLIGELRVEVQESRADNDRLREALERIADETAATWVSEAAREALKGALDADPR